MTPSFLVSISFSMEFTLLTYCVCLLFSLFCVCAVSNMEATHAVCLLLTSLIARLRANMAPLESLLRVLMAHGALLLQQDAMRLLQVLVYLMLLLYFRTFVGLYFLLIVLRLMFCVCRMSGTVEVRRYVDATCSMPASTPNANYWPNNQCVVDTVSQPPVSFFAFLTCSVPFPVLF
jgi:hypothetical protein